MEITRQWRICPRTYLQLKSNVKVSYQAASIIDFTDITDSTGKATKKPFESP
jgi:hypothetical protein